MYFPRQNRPNSCHSSHNPPPSLSTSRKFPLQNLSVTDGFLPKKFISTGHHNPPSCPALKRINDCRLLTFLFQSLDNSQSQRMFRFQFSSIQNSLMLVLPSGIMQPSGHHRAPLSYSTRLSSTTVSTFRICSKATASFIKICDSAPLPIPTINAVGVASPKAHGQAITKTDTAESIA